MAFKASLTELTGPASTHITTSLPVPRELYLKPVDGSHSLRFASQGADDLLNWAGQPFTVLDANGKTVEQGTVPATGRLPRVKHAQYEKLTLRLGDANNAKLNPVARLKATVEIAKEEGVEGESLQHTENSYDAAALRNSRYYQEVSAATVHHQSEFLPESMIDEIINEYSTKA